MADPVLHIKDSYYFEVPKLLYPYDYTRRQQFPDVWISLDPEFQQWDAERLYKALQVRDAHLPPQDKTLGDWHHWTHANHANFAKPLKEFLGEKYQAAVAEYKAKVAVEANVAKAKGEEPSKLTFDQYVEELEAGHDADHDYLPFLKWRHTHTDAFEQAQGKTKENIAEWKNNEHVADWGKEKISAYNKHLSGKILIPQPMATLRNLYERESGFAISKYLLIELFVGLVLILLFSRLAARIERGMPPKGKFWNLLEVFLVFIRDQIARPILGSHDHGHESGHGGEEEHEHGGATHAHAAHDHSGHSHGHNAQVADPAIKFLPLLWTIFFFVLGCNLMGMLPWAGAPTATLAVTLALACITLVTVIGAGMMQFGVAGYFLNQIPPIAVGRPGNPLLWVVAVVFELLLKVMILIIEVGGMLIKNGVLAVRLLANMVAGHLVILGIMGLAFGAEAAIKFSGAPGWQWGATALIAIVASAAFNVLELFVAFLQAYIITFLSALFIGAAIHKH